MFTWDHLFTWSKGPRTVLRLRGTEVARLTQKIGSEQWVADLNQHLDWSDLAGARRTAAATRQGGPV